jgi:phospholipase/carboxylesterase
LGPPLAEAKGAVFLIHGRGGSPHDIAEIAAELPHRGLAYLAPGAPGGSWYPQRFLVPTAHNEPWLSNALAMLDQLAQAALAAGLAAEQIGWIGFSQGACLALEHAARQRRRYGFVAGLSGALIGPLEIVRPAGDLQGLPVLLGCAEADAHIPIEYVEESAATFTRLGAKVTKQIYPGGAHGIFPPEIEWLQTQSSALAQNPGRP